MVFVTDVTNSSESCWQPSLVYTRETATTCEQIQTEKECSLYFDLGGNNPQTAYFEEKGLFLKKNREKSSDNRNLGDQEAETTLNESGSVPMEPQYQVGLLRDAHTRYLHTVFQENQRLRPSFTSLDSSHTWMIYWCLHGLDLLGQWPPPSDEHPLLAQRILSTLQSCWTTSTVSLPKDVVESDPILSLHAKDSLDASSTKNGNSIEFANAGGFGGGPDQLPHAATTYAAVMSLCILASSSNKSDPENTALQYLLAIRVPVYVWLCTLYNPSNGSFRMHIDGEIDVRATYCALAVVHILQMILSSFSCFFTQPRIAEYLLSCQSAWEGGFGGEPGAEAHGGYTYCAVASLHLFYAPSQSSSWPLDSIESCAAWLAQRQMSYEGGFSGRINKLVDGCYSFWQGSAAIIIQEQLRQVRSQSEEKESNRVVQVIDPWCVKAPCSSDREASLSNHVDCLFDAMMLERYILLCSQDENGGLRDKPSKGRDFYHSCYCLSGLSVAQHFGHDITIQNSLQSDVFCNEHTSVHQTHPCYNIRVEHVEFCCSNFREYSP